MGWAEINSLTVQQAGIELAGFATAERLSASQLQERRQKQASKIFDQIRQTYGYSRQELADLPLEMLKTHVGQIAHVAVETDQSIQAALAHYLVTHG